MMADWFDSSQYLVLLSVEDETALHALAERFCALDVPCVVWREPDMDNSLCSLAVAPGTRTRQALANLPLLLREVA